LILVVDELLDFEGNSLIEEEVFADDDADEFEAIVMTDFKLGAFAPTMSSSRTVIGCCGSCSSLSFDTSSIVVITIIVINAQ